MHSLAIQSVSALLTAISSQLQMTPSAVHILDWISVLDEIPDVPDPSEVIDDVVRVYISVSRSL